MRVRIIVWRHELVSHLNRLLYLGEWSIDSEVAKLQSRCQKQGLVCKVFHTITNIVRNSSHSQIHHYPTQFFFWVSLQPDSSSAYANPYDNETDANVIVIIAGNPKGIYSAHHEKLVLIDAECPSHTVAFTGVRSAMKLATFLEEVMFSYVRGSILHEDDMINRSINYRDLIGKI